MRRFAFFMTLAAGCQPAAPAGPPPVQDPGPPSMDMSVFRTLNRTLQDYVDALLLCGSDRPADWPDGLKKYDALQPYQVFAEDPQLFRSMRAGNEAARKELGRRGAILNSLLVFYQPYDRARWDEARKTLLSSGVGGDELLVRLLFTQLLNSQYADLWPHLRYNLVETGEIAFKTAEELLKAYALNAPKTPIFKLDDLTQLFVIVISFGDRGRPILEKHSLHDNFNVRRALSRAIGEAVDGPGAPILVRLLGDGEWMVRAAAAQACCRMGPSRGTVGPALVSRLKKETERYVRRLVLEAIGEVHYEEAVPDLVNALDVPSLEVVTAAMGALYHITGHKFTRKEEWLAWYAEKYPAWKARPR